MQSFNQSLWWVRRLSSTETSHTWYTLLHGLQYFMWGPLVKILPSDKAPAVWHRLPGSNLNQLVSSVAQSCPTLCDPMDWSTPGLPVCYQLPSLLKLMSFESVMPSNHFILCRPLLLPPSILPRIRVFSNESVLCIRWPKNWSFSFRISPSNKYSGLIYFRINGFDLAVQGILKSLLEHHNLKASILQRSAFFMEQPSHLSIANGKTIALII